MNDTDRILAAINSLDSKFSKRLDELEKTVAATRKRQKQYSQKVDNIGRMQQKQQVDIDEVKQIIANLINSDAVIKQKSGKVYLKKECAYDCFENCGIPKSKAMAALAKNNVIETEIEYPKTRRTVMIWNSELKKPIRVISVYVPIE